MGKMRRKNQLFKIKTACLASP